MSGGFAKPPLPQCYIPLVTGETYLIGKYLNGYSDGHAKPFFMYFSPFAPHAPSIPAHRHENLFNDKKAPRTESYNPDDKIRKEKPSWLGRLPNSWTSKLKAVVYRRERVLC